jgi:hypothetical protein
MERDITFNLEVNVEKSLSNIRQYEMILFRCLGLAQRLGLPDNISAGIREVQRMVMMVRLLHTTILALEAASGPVGWALFGIAAATTIATSTDFFDMSRGQ